MHLGKFLRLFSVYKWSGSPSESPKIQDRLPETSHGLGSLIGSSLPDGSGNHRPVLDLDFPCMLVESSNGRYHLLMDKVLSAKDYTYLVETLTEIGILNSSSSDRFETNGQTFVRTPWAIKPQKVNPKDDSGESSEPYGA